MPKLNAVTLQHLQSLAEKGINTLLTGPHGIGKTTMFETLCKKLNYRGAYINVPSSDYFMDWLGLPCPVQEPEDIQTIRWFMSHGGEFLATRFVISKMGLNEDDALSTVRYIHQQAVQSSLAFLRPKRLDGVQFVFFDEINREADPRFVDSCMELVQFNRINGTPLPDLKLVWAAQNPANSIYHVRELDIPLIDKFGAHVFLEGNPSHDYFVARGYSEHHVNAVLSWYEKDLSKEHRAQVSPRCLENILTLAKNDIDVEFGLLASMQIPPHLLKAKLRTTPTNNRFANLTLSTILADVLTYVEYAKTDVDFCIYFTDLIRDPKVKPTDVLRTCLIFMNIQYEFQCRCYSDSIWAKRLKGCLTNAGALPADITSIPNFQTFVEMIKQIA